MTVRGIATVAGVGAVVLAAFVLTARIVGVFPGAGRHQASAVPEQTVVAIDAHNRLYVNTSPTPAEELVRRVQRAIGDVHDKHVYLRADKNARYATVLDAIEDLRAAGISVSLVPTQP
jgi:biopolymer transport protein ExbD